MFQFLHPFRLTIMDIQNIPKPGLIIISREQVKDLLVVELDEGDSDERFDGIANPQVVENVIEGARDDAQFAVLNIHRQVLLYKIEQRPEASF